MFKKLLISAIVLCSASFSLAHEYTVGDVQIHHPWARATPPKAAAAGVFMTLTSQQGDQLVSAASDAAETVEIHEITMNDGVMKMRALPRLELKAKQEVKLAPGGLHIMLFGLKQSFKEGDKFPMTLTFAKAGKVTVDVKIQAMTDSAAASKPHQHE